MSDKKEGVDIVEQRKLVSKVAKMMGLDVPETYVADVVRTGDKIILPDGANLDEVIGVLTKQRDSERQKVSVNTNVIAAPWDGAIALNQAIVEELGLVQALEIPPTWFSPEQPPTEIEVEYELGKTMTVRWGRFGLPGMDGAIATTGVGVNEEGEVVFSCEITTVRRWQSRARKILDSMRAKATTNSIHKGKAFSIQFTVESNGKKIDIPTPKFFRFSTEQPIFRRELQLAIERNIFTPIKHADKVRAMGETLKRGLLFAGRYGVGKTMLASAIAQVCVDHGWTFIYVKNSAELPQALKYAQKFQPVVVFAEDVERIAGMERTDQVNNLLNQLDGVDSKHAQIMTILTSNHSDKVNAAMRRPGRIDMIIQVLPPDAETVSRMVHAFLPGAVEVNADLTGIGTALQNFAPAYIKEACGRARLEALRRTGTIGSEITGEDLTLVAHEVAAERNMFVGSEVDDAEGLRGLAAVGAGLAEAGVIIAKAAGSRTKATAKA